MSDGVARRDQKTCVRDRNFQRINSSWFIFKLLYFQNNDKTPK